MWEDSPSTRQMPLYWMHSLAWPLKWRIVEALTLAVLMDFL